MKKGLFALVALAMVLAAAPDAMADHCWKCQNFTNCVPSTGYGTNYCSDYSGSCVLSGGYCGGPHPLIDTEEPLAAAFVVASVERLDEPQQPRADEGRVALLETTQQTADR